MPVFVLKAAKLVRLAVEEGAGMSVGLVVVRVSAR